MPRGQWVNVPILIKHAERALGRDIKYDTEQFRQLNLRDFNEADYILNDEALARGESLEDIIERHLIPRRMHGANASTIREVFRDDPGIEATIKLLQEGQQPFMRTTFKINGGKEVSYSPSYLRMRPICNDALVELAREGKLLVFKSQDEMERSQQDNKIHISKIVWAPQPTRSKAEFVCMHRQGQKIIPVNKSIDFQAHDAKYGRPNLTNFSKLCELACKQRQRYPSCTKYRDSKVSRYHFIKV